MRVFHSRLISWHTLSYHWHAVVVLCTTIRCGTREMWSAFRYYLLMIKYKKAQSILSSTTDFGDDTPQWSFKSSPMPFTLTVEILLHVIQPIPYLYQRSVHQPAPGFSQAYRKSMQPSVMPPVGHPLAHATALHCISNGHASFRQQYNMGPAMFH